MSTVRTGVTDITNSIHEVIVFAKSASVASQPCFQFTIQDIYHLISLNAWSLQTKAHIQKIIAAIKSNLC